ncbi:hypothetical protein [Salininema proteolyticum]|uniref:Uncharacterized protein n=1 Tax=Salininema proteolyticum TaxID=1607685 RepID=A0ABV8TYY1_9ACTN
MDDLRTAVGRLENALWIIGTTASNLVIPGIGVIVAIWLSCTLLREASSAVRTGMITINIVFAVYPLMVFFSF